MKFNTTKLLKILLAVFVMVFSFTVLAAKIPETKYMQETVDYLEDTQSTIMTFSGVTLATSLAMSALPDDFASPLAETISDLNTYFILMFAIIFIEKLLVVEGTTLSLTYIIPAALAFYVIAILTAKEVFKEFSTKLLILGISLVLVIPFSTHFTNSICADYLDYVEETINESSAKSEQINNMLSMGENADDAGFFDKVSNVFTNIVDGATELVEYFKGFIKKSVNSIAIMLVINFALPLGILFLFRWLLKELFAINIPTPKVQIRLPKKAQDVLNKALPRIEKELDAPSTEVIECKNEEVE